MFIGTVNIGNRALCRSAMLASVAHKWAQAIKYRLLSVYKRLVPNGTGNRRYYRSVSTFRAREHLFDRD